MFLTDNIKMDRQYQSPHATLMTKIHQAWQKFFVDAPFLLYLFIYFHFKYTNLSIYINIHMNLSTIKNY